MQAIRTKVLAPTNHRPPRVVAECEAGRIVVPWNYSLGVDGNYMAAARQLHESLGWDDFSTLHGGWLPSNVGGCAFVLIPKAKEV